MTCLLRSRVWLIFLATCVAVGDASSANAEIHTFSVSATRNEQSPLATSFFVPRRAYVRVDVTGSITIAPGKPSTPDGVVGTVNRPNGMTFGAPVVVIGGVHWSIEGGVRAWTSPHSGNISLYIADVAPSDNTGSYTFTVEVGDALSGDQDEDGIDDVYEDELLDGFAPSLRFDDSEDAWPSTVQWHARLSSVEFDFCNPDRQALLLINQETTTPFFPEWHIARDWNREESCGALCEEREMWRKSNLLDLCDTPSPLCRDCPGNNENISASGWSMGHDNTWRVGEGPARLAASNYRLGMYGRVHPVTRTFQEGNVDLVQISYFHFYSYSDIDVTGPDIGAHEGDWEFYNVFVVDSPGVAPNLNMLIGAEWWAHGKRVEWWRDGYTPIEIPVSPNPPPQDGGVGVWYDYQTGLNGGCVERKGNWSPVNNLHLPAFIQPHGHGFFPTSFQWKVDGLQLVCYGNADAEGTSVFRGVPAEVANVGELYRPRLGMELICQYSGYWGSESKGNTPPKGPPLSMKHWPGRAPGSSIVLSSLQAAYVGRWNCGRTMPNSPAPAPLGRISWPYQFLGDAFAVQADTRSNVVHLYPGTYGDRNLVIVPLPDETIVLKAPHGGVIVGQ